MTRYLLGGRKYCYLPDETFMDLVTKEITKKGDYNYEKLILRVKVGFSTDLPKKYHMNCYRKIQRLKR